MSAISEVIAAPATPLSFDEKAKVYGATKTIAGMQKEEGAFIEKMLEDFPDEPKSKNKTLFNYKMRVLTRTQPEGLINCWLTNCWFNSLVQGYYKQPAIRALLEEAKEHSDSLRPEIKCARLLLLEIIELSEEEVPEDVSARFEFNKKLEKTTWRFLKSCQEKSQLFDLYDHQCPAEGFRIVNDFLGFDDTAGYPRKKIGTDSLIKTTQLVSACSLYGIETKTEREPKLEPAASINLPVDSGSVKEGVQRTFMRPEELEKENWVNFAKKGGKKEPTLKTMHYCSIRSGEKLQIGERSVKVTKELGAPLVLPVQILRFSRDQKTGAIEKDASPITFDSKLNIPLYDPTGKTPRKLAAYSLSSLVLHQGGYSKGHVTCLTQKGEDVVCFDDSKVTRFPYTNIQKIENVDKLGYLALYTQTGSFNFESFQEKSFLPKYPEAREKALHEIETRGSFSTRFKSLCSSQISAAVGVAAASIFIGSIYPFH